MECLLYDFDKKDSFLIYLGWYSARPLQVRSPSSHSRRPGVLVSLGTEFPLRGIRLREPSEIYPRATENSRRTENSNSHRNETPFSQTKDINDMIKQSFQRKDLRITDRTINYELSLCLGVTVDVFITCICRNECVWLLSGSFTI